MQEKYKLDFDRLSKVESWKEFDENLTVKIHSHFQTVADYYYASSCFSKIKDIKKPTLVIHSKDDPIIPIECLPVTECLANEKMIVGIVRKGGHVCYFQGLKGQKRWYPYVSAEYLDAVIQLKENDLSATERLALGSTGLLV